MEPDYSYAEPNTYDMEKVRVAIRQAATHRFAYDDLTEVYPVIDWLVAHVLVHEGGRHNDDCVNRWRKEQEERGLSAFDANDGERTCICAFPPIFKIDLDDPCWWL